MKDYVIECRKRVKTRFTESLERVIVRSGESADNKTTSERGIR